MDAKTRVLIAVGAAVVVAGAAATVSLATGGDDLPLTGNELDRATAAALTHTGEGRVVESEAGEDGSAAYEVGVLLDDGSVVEVHLDENFVVIGSEADAESGGESGESGESQDGDLRDQ